MEFPLLGGGGGAGGELTLEQDALNGSHNKAVIDSIKFTGLVPRMRGALRFVSGASLKASIVVIIAPPRRVGPAPAWKRDEDGWIDVCRHFAIFCPIFLSNALM